MSENKPKIYCFLNGGILLNGGIPGDRLHVVAIAEDGKVLAYHGSNDEYQRKEYWAQIDIGILSKWKHDQYKEYYPNGYELEWVKDFEDEGFKLAVKRNQA